MTLPKYPELCQGLHLHPRPLREVPGLGLQRAVRLRPGLPELREVHQPEAVRKRKRRLQVSFHGRNRTFDLQVWSKLL